MAFARVDTAGVAGTGAGADESYSFTMTSGVNLALFFVCVWENVSQQVTIDDIDWNTTEAPTFIDSQRDGTGRAIIHAYYLDNPTTGSHDLDVTFSGDTTDNVCVMFTFSDAESGASVTASKAYEATGDTAHALAATSVAGDIVVDVVGVGGTPGGDYYTAAGDNTKIGALVTEGPWPAWSYATASDTSTDMDWDWTGGNSRSSISVAVAVAAGASTDRKAIITAWELQVPGDPPTAPSGLALDGDQDDENVPLQWTDNASNETGYYVQRDTSPGFTPGAGKRVSSDLGANAESWTDTTVSANQQYYYKVEAYNAYGSSYSNELSVKTAPARPTGVFAVSSPYLATYVDVKWTDQTSGGFGHNIWSRAAGSGAAFVWAGYADAGQTQYRVYDLPPTDPVIDAAIAYEDGVGYTNYTSEANSRDTESDVAIFPSNPAENDAFYFGWNFKFHGLYVRLNSALSVSSAVTWEYYNGSGWSTLTTFLANNSDFSSAPGYVTLQFYPPSNWATTTVNSQGPYYYIRARGNASMGGANGAVAGWAETWQDQRFTVTAYNVADELNSGWPSGVTQRPGLLRKVRVTAWELETPSIGRKAVVTAWELQVGDAARKGRVTAWELQTGDAGRKARVTAWELQTGDAGRKARVTAWEMEVPGADNRKAIVTAWELQVGDAGRKARVTAWELETPNADRRAVVTAFELQVGDAARRGLVTAWELETPIAGRKARVTAWEFQVGNAPRKARVTAWELQTPDPARKARVTAWELETPNADRKAIVTAWELQTGDAGRKAIVTAWELQTGDAGRKALVTAWELEVPTAPRKARVTAWELELGDAGRRGRVTAWELEVPSTVRKAIITAWELEVPNADRRGRVTAFELEGPEAGRRAVVTAWELELPVAARKAKVTAWELQTEDAARRGVITAWELETPNADRRAVVTAWELQAGDAGRKALVTAWELEAPNANRRAVITAWELELPPETRRAVITAFELSVPSVVTGPGVRMLRIGINRLGMSIS